MKTKNIFISLLVVALLAVAFSTVYAGLTFREASAGVGSISGSFLYTGAGRGTDVVLVATVTGDNLSATCINRGGNVAPGQGTFNISYNSSQTFKADRNGRVEGSYYFDIRPDTSTAGCPNRNWRVGEMQGTVYVNLTVTNTSRGDSDSATFQCNLGVSGPCTRID